MQKDFDRWNRLKKDVNARKDAPPFFHEREVWWCNLGLNVGFEQDGKGGRFERPVLVLKKFNHDVFIAVPLSSRAKKNPYYLPFVDPNGDVQSALISQIRLLDARRLMEKTFTIDQGAFKAIQKAVRQFFA
jgi:mRNA interferase MazF